MFYGIFEQYADDIVIYRLDLMDDQSYLLHAKTTSFCITFVLVIVNPTLFDKPRFLTSESTWQFPSHGLLEGFVPFPISLNLQETYV